MKKQRKRIGTLGTQAVKRLRKMYFLGLRGLRNNRYERKECKKIVDHQIQWNGGEYVCSICGKKFNPVESQENIDKRATKYDNRTNEQ